MIGDYCDVLDPMWTHPHGNTGTVSETFEESMKTHKIPLSYLTFDRELGRVSLDFMVDLLKLRSSDLLANDVKAASGSVLFGRLASLPSSCGKVYL